MFKKTRAVKIKEKSVGPAEIAISSVALQKMWHSVAKYTHSPTSWKTPRYTKFIWDCSNLLATNKNSPTYASTR